MKERAQELKAAVRLVLLPRAGRGALPILPSRPTCVEGDFDTVLDEPHFRAGRFVPNYNDGDSRLLNVAPPCRSEHSIAREHYDAHDCVDRVVANFSSSWLAR